MFCPGTATLADGRIIVTGGQSSALTSIYNPLNDTWVKGPKMAVGRGYQSQTLLSDGSVFVFGGSWSGGIGGKFGELYTELPGAPKWTWKGGIDTSGSVVTNDTQGLYRSDSHMWMFEAPNGRIFHAGPSKRMHWFDLNGNGTMTESVYVTTLSSLCVSTGWSVSSHITCCCSLRGDDTDAMNGNALMFDIDKIFTVGGAANYDSGPGSDRAYVIDISGPEAVVERQGNMLWQRAFCNSVVLPNGQILVAGGQLKVKLFSDSDGILPMELFDPPTKRFYELRKPLKVPRNYHSVAVLSKDGRVVVGGGGLCGNSCNYATTFVSSHCCVLPLTRNASHVSPNHAPSEPSKLRDCHSALLAECFR